MTKKKLSAAELALLMEVKSVPARQAPQPSYAQPWKFYGNPAHTVKFKGEKEGK